MEGRDRVKVFDDTVSCIKQNDFAYLSIKMDYWMQWMATNLAPLLNLIWCPSYAPQTSSLLLSSFLYSSYLLPCQSLFYAHVMVNLLFSKKPLRYYFVLRLSYLQGSPITLRQSLRSM